MLNGIEYLTTWEINKPGTEINAMAKISGNIYTIFVEDLIFFSVESF